MPTRHDPLTLVILVLGGVALVLTAWFASGVGTGHRTDGADVGTTGPPAVTAPPPAAAPVPPVAQVDTSTVELAADPGPHGVQPVPRAAPSWVEQAAQVTGVPPTAVRAYADATLALSVEQPGCGLGWTSVAAIGAVESGHGAFGGATLGPDGQSVPSIIGPALDGDGVAAIAATPDGTRWHGDSRWEHAIGPMQFLPGTWQRWGADGDGDGLADPHDLHDAALAAARYLCADGRDLTDADGWTAAVLSYNRSEEYLHTVHGTASTLRDRLAAVRTGS